MYPFYSLVDVGGESRFIPASNRGQSFFFLADDTQHICLAGTHLFAWEAQNIVTDDINRDVNAATFELWRSSDLEFRRNECTGLLFNLTRGRHWTWLQREDQSWQHCQLIPCTSSLLGNRCTTHTLTPGRPSHPVMEVPDGAAAHIHFRHLNPRAFDDQHNRHGFPAAPSTTTCAVQLSVASNNISSMYSLPPSCALLLNEWTLHSCSPNKRILGVFLLFLLLIHDSTARLPQVYRKYSC